MTDLDALSALLDEATPGPWACNCPVDPGDWCVYGGPDDFIVFDGGQRTEDAHLTAALRNAAPHLLAVVRAALDAQYIAAHADAMMTGELQTAILMTLNPKVAPLSTDTEEDAK